MLCTDRYQTAHGESTQSPAAVKIYIMAGDGFESLRLNVRLPCAVMHGGLVGSQSLLAAICINNLLRWAIHLLMRRGALLYFTLPSRLII